MLMHFVMRRYKKSCLTSTHQNGTKEEGGHLRQEGGGGHLNGTKDDRGVLRQEAGAGGKIGGGGCQGGAPALL